MSDIKLGVIFLVFLIAFILLFSWVDRIGEAVGIPLLP